MERDGWQEKGYKQGIAFYEKPLANDLILRKEFGWRDNADTYQENHILLDAQRNILLDGKAWEWADFDILHKRIVYAEKGCMYSISLCGSKLESKRLYDFNDMQFEALTAPY